MKVRITGKYADPREMDLASFLQPTNTGSEQGALEQVKAELEVANSTIGSIMAVLVENRFVTLEKAMEMSGMHSFYIEYKFGIVELVP